MPTPTKGPRLGGSSAHQRLLLANLATELFRYGRITTTETKAKRLRPLAETLITRARRDDLAARRRVRRIVRDKDVFVSLFEEIAPRYLTRPGGYTRIIKIGPRKGDSAPMAIIELVLDEIAPAAPARTAKAPARKDVKAEAVAALAGDDEETMTPVAGSSSDETMAVAETDEVEVDKKDDEA